MNDQSLIFNVSAVPVGNILVLAPHPDDFDAIAVTLRLLRDAGREIFLALATSGDSGVEDAYMNGFQDMTKSQVREAEQAASLAFFGIPASNFLFLRLDEDENGDPEESKENSAKIADCLRELSPGVVFLPHWNDTNAAHQRVYEMFAESVRTNGMVVTAYLNRDPKTRFMRHDIYTPFDESAAEWKGELLRFHDSQHQRNLNTRGHGFDERVLAVNREIAKDLKLDAPYAEVFEVVSPKRRLPAYGVNPARCSVRRECLMAAIMPPRDGEGRSTSY